MQRGGIITCLLGIWLLWLGSTAPIAVAEEVAIHYQVLNTLPGLKSATWTIKLELRNLSGEELQNLSVGLVTSLPFISDEGVVGVGTLPTTEPRMITADFTVGNEYLPLNEESLRFSLRYETVDGIPRSAILQGQPVVFIGEGTP